MNFMPHFSAHHFVPPMAHRPPARSERLARLIAQMAPAGVTVLHLRTRILAASSLNPVRAMTESVRMVTEKPEAFVLSAVQMSVDLWKAHWRFTRLIANPSASRAHEWRQELAGIWDDYMSIPHRAIMPIYERLMDNARRLSKEAWRI